MLVFCEKMTLQRQAHNLLKVVGSNPTPATSFARRLQKLAGDRILAVL
jgi:hypothetical protein